ncbi:MAG: hypothetical protein PHV30_03040 [Candidatus Margulisbacteria bacterium]|nr:hypothetical protein [Candidatus Margulisiibacteriota bacterium]
MARRILILLLIISFCFAFDYEVIKNRQNQDDITTIYLNNKEVLSLMGADVVSLKKAYSFIARLMQFDQLNYDEKDITVRKIQANQYIILWSDQKLLSFNEQDKLLNDARGNSLDKLRKFVESIKTSDRPAQIILPQRSFNIRQITQIKEININMPKDSKFFPAVHPSLPLGTKLRVLNPSKDWSIVVQIVKNDNLGLENSLGLNARAISALGFDNQAVPVIRTQLL